MHLLIYLYLFALYVLAPICQNLVAGLHEMPRRLRTYRVNYGEQSLTDHAIKEGWYNVQDFRMSNVADNAKLGDCGTFYPIVLNSECFIKTLFQY